MRFLSRLLGKKEMPESAAAISVPSVKAPPELFKAFSIVFYEVMGTVAPFTKTDLDTMHGLITQGRGHIDMSHWYNQVFETHFADKDCHWPELEEWNSIFIESGRKPILTAGNHALDLRHICSRLNAASLKAALKTLGIPFSSKAKKDDLIQVLEETTTLEKFLPVCLDVGEVLEEETKKRRKAFYELLFQTITGRVNNLSSKLRQTALNAKWKIETPAFCAQDKPFVRLALKKNPNAIPPLFPGDNSLFLIDLADASKTAK